MKTQNKFNIGDTIEIINYGHLMHVAEGYLSSEKLSPPANGWCTYDSRPERIGSIAIVTKISDFGVNNTHYGLHFIKGSYLGSAAWFNEGQMKMIKKYEL